ncbi:hypothetical protein [Paenibacillus sp. TH7-28]
MTAAQLAALSGTLQDVPFFGEVELSRQLEQPTTIGLQNSGILCTYYPEPGMFTPTRGTLCPYFPMNGPECRNFLQVRENSDIKCPYFSQMDRIAGIATFYVLIFLWSFSDSLVFAGFLGVIPKS